LRILQINASYKPAYIYGGPTMSVSKLSEELVKTGCTVAVFTTTANGAAELPVTSALPQDVDGVPVRYFKRSTKDHSHFSPGLLAALWKEVRSFDVVHVHAWWNLVSVLGCGIAILRGVPVILSPRGTLSSYTFTNRNSTIKKILHKVIGEPLLNRCFIHTTSERERAAMAELLKPKGIFTIYNFVNLPAVTPVKLPGNGTLKLLFLSRIEEKKGLELLFGALAQTAIPYRLTIAGSGDEAYIAMLKKLSEEYKVEDQIDWVGFKSADKFEMIAAHHLLVLPSYDENFGNVVIESLAMGTAVLISNAVGLAEYTKSNRLGWICDTDALSVKNSLEEIYHSPAQLDVIRERAPAIIRDDFKEDTIIKQYYNMYNKISNHG
jgi:glycosyltransferase involved in cell wall biosynthesis